MLKQDQNGPHVHTTFTRLSQSKITHLQLLLRAAAREAKGFIHTKSFTIHNKAFQSCKQTQSKGKQSHDAWTATTYRYSVE